MERFWKVLTFLAALFGVLAITSQGQAANVSDSKAAIVVDAQSGQILYQQNIDQRLPIASLTKLLTVLVVEDEVKQGQLTWNTRVKITPDIAAIANNPEYSNVGLQVGQKYTVENLVRAALVKSADGATLALASAAGDDTVSFNQKLQAKAHALGVTDAKLVNAVGLANGDLPAKRRVLGLAEKTENEMSARDVAKIASYLVVHSQHLNQITQQAAMTLKINATTTKTIRNINELITGTQYAVGGVRYTGLKTGTSDAAGYCLASSATYHQRQLVTVVLHANGGPTSRFTATQHLYQWLQAQQLTPRKLQLKAHKKITVRHGVPTQINTTMPGLVWWTCPQTVGHKYPALVKINHSKNNDQIEAPVKKGQEIGSIQLKTAALETLDQKPLTAGIYAKQTVTQANLLQILWYKITH